MTQERSTEFFKNKKKMMQKTHDEQNTKTSHEDENAEISPVLPRWPRCRLAVSSAPVLQLLSVCLAFSQQVVQMVKSLPAVRETWV